MAKRQVDKSKLEYASHPPEWILPLSDLELSGSERETIDFFLVTSPCKGVSARGVPLTSYGWDRDTPEKNGYLQNRLMKSANLRESENFFVGTKREDMKAVFNDAAMDNAFYEKHFDNRIAFLASGNTVLSLFRAVRNSFAHSRFNVIDIGSERFFIMENEIPNGI